MLRENGAFDLPLSLTCSRNWGFSRVMFVPTHRAAKPCSPAPYFLLNIFLLASCHNPEHSPPSSSGHPQRVVSQTNLSDEILFALGPEVQQRVIAVSKFADDPRYSSVAKQWPPKVRRLSARAEDLLHLQPDLVILANFSSAEVRSLIQAMGVPTLSLEGFSGFEDYRRHVRTIAGALGLPQRGEDLVARFDQKLKDIGPEDPASPEDSASEDPASNDPKRGTAAQVLSWNEGIVAGARTTFHDAAEHAGLRNLPTEKGLRGHRRIRFEQLATWNPGLIVLGCALDCAQARAQFVSSPAAATLEAVKNGRILTVPNRVLSATGRDMLTLVSLLRKETGLSKQP